MKPRLELCMTCKAPTPEKGMVQTWRNGTLFRLDCKNCYEQGRQAISTTNPPPAARELSRRRRKQRKHNSRSLP